MKQSKAYLFLIRRLLNDYREKNLPLSVKLVYKKDGRDKFLFYGQVYPKLNTIEFKSEILEYDEFVYYQAIFQPNDYSNWNNFLSTFQGDPETSTQSNYYVRIGEIDLRCNREEISTERYPTWLGSYKDLNLSNEFPFIYSIHLFDINDYAYSGLNTKNTNLSYYPELKDLIFDKFGFKFHRMDTFRGTLHIHAYSIKGYVSNINTEGKNSRIDIEKFTSEKFTLKLYAECAPSGCYVKNFSFLGGKSKIHLPANVTSGKMILVDEEGETIDQKEFDTKNSTTVEFVQSLILSGEGMTVDFKKWESNLVDKSKKEKRIKQLAKLMSAFANTEGGYILFGVDNEAEIVGLDKSELNTIETMLQNIVDTKIRPPILITHSEVIIENSTVGVIKIDKSSKIVLNFYDKHYYIRRGSTNRIMQPEEISNFRKRSSTA